MKEAIFNLEPREVWKHFHSLTRIPRPSGHEGKVRLFLTAFTGELGLETIVDRAGNVIVRKPATPGMENRTGVILQAHLDMVPQKNGETKHDFERDPIRTVIEGGWVRADGTTLGADNGIGVAAAMALLASSRLVHGPLEALFTVEEETGMAGAFGLEPGMLRGGILLNLDSEEEGELFIGCAGGVNGTATFSFLPQRLQEGYAGFTIRVRGLKGGHSGMDIHLGSGNANKIMNRLLFAGHVRQGLLLASIEGGSLRNAIPRESKAVVAVPASRAGEFLDGFSALAEAIGNELSVADPGLFIEAVPVKPPLRVIDERVSARLLQAVCACPDGVMRMNSEMEGLVETSNNLAVVRSGHESVTVSCLLRSSVDSARQELETMIGSVFGLAGAVTSFEGGYHGWKPDRSSAILKLMQEIHAGKFGKAPMVRAVHAGLECGIIGGTCPGLDMISFGPTIRHPHSPDERVHIGSVGRFWDLLVETLVRVPAARS
jgi:dipeptidase D